MRDGESAVPIDDGRCFACGPKNPIGLCLEFERAGSDEVFCWTVLSDEFQGWQNIAHGGIGMTLLDEAMAHAAAAKGYRGVTASMNVRFRKPVPLNVPVAIEGHVIWQRRNVVGLRAMVRDEDGTLLLEGEGSFVSMGSVHDADDRRTPQE